MKELLIILAMVLCFSWYIASNTNFCKIENSFGKDPVTVVKIEEEYVILRDSCGKEMRFYKFNLFGCLEINDTI